MFLAVGLAFVVTGFAKAEDCLDSVNKERAKAGTHSIVLCTQKAQDLAAEQALYDSEHGPHHWVNDFDWGAPDGPHPSDNFVDGCIGQGGGSNYYGDDEEINWPSAVQNQCQSGPGEGHYDGMVAAENVCVACGVGTAGRHDDEGDGKIWYVFNYYDKECAITDTCTDAPTPSPTPQPSPPGGSTWYRTITPSSNTGLCLDLPGGDTTPGTGLWLWECNGAESQRWVFDAYQIRFGADESKCVDAGDMSNGHTAVLWDCNGYPQQDWSYDSDASRIYLSNTITCMDFFADQQWNGQPVHTWECNGEGNQEWGLWNVNSNSAGTAASVSETFII